MLGLHSNVNVNINYIDPATGVRIMDAAYASLSASGKCPEGYCELAVPWTIERSAVPVTTA